MANNTPIKPLEYNQFEDCLAFTNKVKPFDKNIEKIVFFFHWGNKFKFDVSVIKAPTCYRKDTQPLCD